MSTEKQDGMKTGDRSHSPEKNAGHQNPSKRPSDGQAEKEKQKYSVSKDDSDTDTDSDRDTDSPRFNTKSDRV